MQIADRNWPTTGLTTQSWIDTVSVLPVPVLWIVPTQRHLDLPALISNPPTIDVYAHVVYWDARFFLEDGHHRFARAVLRGDEFLEARVFRSL
jgi:hypothetical protein